MSQPAQGRFFLTGPVEVGLRCPPCFPNAPQVRLPQSFRGDLRTGRVPLFVGRGILMIRRVP